MAVPRVCCFIRGVNVDARSLRRGNSHRCAEGLGLEDNYPEPSKRGLGEHLESIRTVGILCGPASEKREEGVCTCLKETNRNEHALWGGGVGRVRTLGSHSKKECDNSTSYPLFAAKNQSRKIRNTRGTK